MLFYRLILLSWVICGLFLKVGSIKSPEVQSSLQDTGKNENENELRPRYLRPRHLRYRNAALRKHPQYEPLIQIPGKRKSLMTQVLASSMRHHGDHPRKFIDFLDNGAQWHHFISKPRGHNKELRINEGNFHVNLKYGNHDLQEQDDRRYRNTDSMYVGDTISGENSLSKFTAPPVYDEESANYQRKTKLDLNYEADTPEAVATEKQNTEQFVNRLHALMPPLSTPYEFHKGRGKAATHKMIQEGKHAEKIYDQDEGDFGHQGYLRQIEPENGKSTGRNKKYDDGLISFNKPNKEIDIAAVEDISKFEKDPSMYDNQEINLKTDEETRNIRKEDNDEGDASNNDVSEKDATYRPRNDFGKNEMQSEMETGDEERGQAEESKSKIEHQDDD